VILLRAYNDTGGEESWGTPTGELTGAAAGKNTPADFGCPGDAPGKASRGGATKPRPHPARPARAPARTENDVPEADPEIRHPGLVPQGPIWVTAPPANNRATVQRPHQPRKPPRLLSMRGRMRRRTGNDLTSTAPRMKLIRAPVAIDIPSVMTTTATIVTSGPRYKDRMMSFYHPTAVPRPTTIDPTHAAGERCHGQTGTSAESSRFSRRPGGPTPITHRQQPFLFANNACPRGFGKAIGRDARDRQPTRLFNHPVSGLKPRHLITNRPRRQHRRQPGLHAKAKRTHHPSPPESRHRRRSRRSNRTVANGGQDDPDRHLRLPQIARLTSAALPPKASPIRGKPIGGAAQTQVTAHPAACQHPCGPRAATLKPGARRPATSSGITFWAPHLSRTRIEHRAPPGDTTHGQPGSTRRRPVRAPSIHGVRNAARYG